MKTIKSLKYALPVFYLTVIFISGCKQETANQKLGGQLQDSVKHAEAPNPYATNDQSPMDMSYYPSEYPILKMNGTDSNGLVARVIYSRPKKKGRVIFGYNNKSLRQYGKEWRLGANEATEIEFFRDVTVADKRINKGRYIIYCIPYPDKWTIVLNSNLYTWGLHMDNSKDVFKTDVPVTSQSPALEDFTMVFEQAPNGTRLIMAWDTLKVVLPITFIQ